MAKQKILFLTILFASLTCYAQQEYVFEHFSIPEGLSNPTVFSVVQDSYGFIWAGTADGLNRYDGYEFKVYKNDPADSFSFPGGGEIWAICEDADKNLWIGGQGFLVLYDRLNDNFKRVTFDFSHYVNPSPLIYSILSDSKNRVWVSSRGHGIQIINPENLTATYKKFIVDGEEARMNMNFSVTETQSGEILVPDMGSGILKYNEEQDAFEKYDIPGITRTNLILKVFEDEMKNLWLSNWQGELQKYNVEKMELETVDIYKSVEMQSPDPSVVEIYKDQEGFIWFGTFNNGLFRYNPVTERFVYFPSNTSNPNNLHGNDISSVIQDKFGILWIGTFSSGLNKVDPKKQPFNVYRLPKEIRKNTNDDNITSIYKSKNEDEVWLGTSGSGLVQMDLAGNKYKNYTADTVSLNSISSNNISAVTGDEQGNIWIGTNISLNKLNTKNGKITEYIKGETTPGAQYQINDVKVDNTGRVYVANTNGIEVLYPLQNQVKRISTINNRTLDPKLFNDFKELIIDENIVAAHLQVGENRELSSEFTITESKKIAIICGGEGILVNNICYDTGWLEDEKGEVIWNMSTVGSTFHLGGGMKNRLKVGVLELDPGKYNLKYKSDIGHSYSNWNVEAPSDSAQWGIQVMEISNSTFEDLNERIKFELEKKNYLPISGASFIEFSKMYENTIWIGSTGAGLFRYNVLDQSYTQYKIDSSEAAEPNRNNVGFVMEDNDGRVWFSSIIGLGLLQPESGEIKYYTQKEGLPSNFVSAFQEDNYGNIWISSVAGLTMMVKGNESEKETFVNIDIKDGLQGYTFSRAAFKNEKGELYFGGRNGINVFLPGRTNQSLPEIVFTDMKISDQSVVSELDESPLTKALNDTKEITLNYDQNDIAFNFSPIHYSRPGRNQIAYRLDGFNKDWVYTKLRFASFTNLEPGEYLFRLKAANGDGVWSDKEKTIAISILPPWWDTTLAYVFYGLAIIGLFFGINNFQNRRLLAKARERARIKEAEMRATIAEAENDRKSKELEEARQLQLSMLPKELPQLPNLDIAVYMKTASEVGGDYYDFNVGMDGTLTVVIGDATGHGMKAGTMVTATKSLFNTHAANPDILFTFNEITRCIKQMQFHMISMCLTILKISGNQVQLSSAGMPPTLIFRKEDMSVEEFVLKGMPLGAVNDFPYQLKNTTISPGDTLLLLSDGLPELFNKEREMFSYERVVQEFSKAAHKSPEEIINSLNKAGSNWTEGGDPDDDITFVVIKVK